MNGYEKTVQGLEPFKSMMHPEEKDLLSNLQGELSKDPTTESFALCLLVFCASDLCTATVTKKTAKEVALLYKDCAEWGLKRETIPEIVKNHLAALVKASNKEARSKQQ